MARSTRDALAQTISIRESYKGTQRWQLVSLDASRQFDYDSTRPRRAWVAPGGMVDHALNRAVARSPLFQKEADYAAFERVLLEAIHLDYDQGNNYFSNTTDVEITRTPGNTKGIKPGTQVAVAGKELLKQKGEIMAEDPAAMTKE